MNSEAFITGKACYCQSSSKSRHLKHFGIYNFPIIWSHVHFWYKNIYTSAVLSCVPLGHENIERMELHSISVSRIFFKKASK